jgi:hypothetical protein
VEAISWKPFKNFVRVIEQPVLRSWSTLGKNSLEAKGDRGIFFFPLLGGGSFK